MKKRAFSIIAGLVMLAGMILSGCSGNGVSGAAALLGIKSGSSGNTVISGKVTLSGTIASSKPGVNPFITKNKLSYNSGSTSGSSLPSSEIRKILAAAGLNNTLPLANANVELYDADRPEWLYPVSVAQSDGNGNYSLSALANAANNTPAGGAAPYSDGDPIPPGNYTIIASKIDPILGRLVAVQAVVKNFSGEMSGNDFVVQNSDAVPAVKSILGLPKNLDGSFGNSTTLLPANSAIQITFNMAMDRLSVLNAVTINNASGLEVSGIWKVSPDLVTVTFYPANPFTPNTVYTISITGGKAMKPAVNVYGTPLPSSVAGTFKATVEDKTPPTAIRNRPANREKPSMPIMTPIRIAADEPIDINTINLTSSPSIGAKPSIKFVGMSEAVADTNYPYIYEIIPSTPLQLATIYAITVRDGRDLAGNPMDTLNFSFSTEAVSAGITATPGTADYQAQLAVKDVLGKWINAMNSGNATLLTTYMSGDFFWINDTSKGMSPDDLNRDGRMSLYEFTTMLESWFSQIQHCGSTVTGSLSGDIVLSSATEANIAFNLNVTSTNTTDPSCSDSGPNNTLYAVINNINGAWLMTRGAEMQIGTFPPPLTIIERVAPVKGAQLPDPTSGAPLLPTFEWTVPDLSSAPSASQITTYLVVLIDNKSPYQQTGWVALVDAGAALPGTSLSAQYNPVPGDYGNMIVAGFGQNGNNPMGFNRMITSILAGGDYSWAVLGFNTKTLADFKVMNFDPAQYLSASSSSGYFTVGGKYRELTLVVKDSSGTVYPYSTSDNGYSVGAASKVNLTVTTPDTTITQGCFQMYGYTSVSGALSFSSGIATITGLDLSNGRNWLEVSDAPCNTSYGNIVNEDAGLWKQFGIYTTGGTPPVIAIKSVTGYECDGTTDANIGTMDSWNNFPLNQTVCTADVLVNVAALYPGTSIPTNITNVNVNVWNNNGLYNNSYDVTPLGTDILLADVQLYNGQNNINMSAWDNINSTNSNNWFNISTNAGVVYTPPITITVTGPGTTFKGSGSLTEAYYDSTGNSVTLAYTMQSIDTSGCGQNNNCAAWWQDADPNWSRVDNGITTLSQQASSITATLFNGWNRFMITDGLNNYYQAYVYSTGGEAFTPPNAITQIDATPVSGYASYGTTNCSVTIVGSTTAGGQLSVYLNNGSFSEWNQVTPTGSGPYDYSFTMNVYNGTNNISVNDANGQWAGARISVNSSSCVPVALNVTEIDRKQDGVALVPDTYGDYNAGDATQYVTIKGTAKQDKTVTLFVSGVHSMVTSVTAGAGDTFMITDVPVYAGYNYLSLNDGSSWVYKTVYTNGPGATWVPPINSVNVTGDGTYAAKSYGGGASDASSGWNTDASTVTITGSAQVDGNGYWSQSGGNNSSGSFTIAGGTFTLSGIQLGYGYNYIDLYDKNWNGYNVSIYTTGGIGAPVQLVKITSPIQGATVSGQITVKGTVDRSFSPTTVYAYVYDYTTSTSTYYSSNPMDFAYGYQTLSYASGAFSFTTSIAAGHMANIEVYAYEASGTSHAHYIYVNNTPDYTPYFWKLGNSGLNQSKAIEQAHHVDFLMRIKK